MITKELIRKGIESKVIRLEADPMDVMAEVQCAPLENIGFILVGKSQKN